MRHWKIMSAALAAVAVAGIVVAVSPAAAAASPCQATLRIGDAEASEGAGVILFPVTVSTTPVGCEASGWLKFRTDPFSGPNKGAEIGSDYAYTEGQVTWRSNHPLSIPVEINNNFSQEVKESFSVRLLSASAGIFDDWGLGTIIDDDPIASLSTPICGLVSRVCQFPLGLSVPATVPVTVTYMTVDGTARAGEDFVGVRDGRLTIPAGSDRATVTVELLPNVGGEPEERFELVLTGVSPGSIGGTGRVEATIPAGS